MEKLSDILHNIKDRLSNPFIFSFICSWIIFNWEIVISLIWYDKAQIKNVGCNSIYDFIQWKLDSKHSLLFPILFASSYTILSPLFKNLITAFYSWMSAWGTKWNYKIIKGGSISVGKYLNLRENYNKRTEILEKIIAQESEIQNKYSDSETQLLIVKTELNQLKQQETDSKIFIQQLYDFRLLNGYWENTFEFEDGRIGKEDIFIEEGKYYLINNFNEKKQMAEIMNFIYDNRNNIVFFIKTMTDMKKIVETERAKFNINQLRFENKDTLIGTENGTTKIQYKRKTSA